MIGTPGDVIKIENGILFINGKEDYSDQIPENQMHWRYIKIKVPSNKVFLWAIIAITVTTAAISAPSLMTESGRRGPLDYLAAWPVGLLFMPFIK